MQYKQVKIIFFTSKADFKDRIVKLLNSRKNDEVYEFSFANEEIHDEFKEFMSKFAKREKAFK